jgi:hypothetical protein
MAGSLCDSHWMSPRTKPDQERQTALLFSATAGFDISGSTRLTKQVLAEANVGVESVPNLIVLGVPMVPNFLMKYGPAVYLFAVAIALLTSFLIF